MNIISLIKILSKEKNKYEECGKEGSHNTSACITANMLKHMSLDCFCGEICIPAEQRGDVYRCIRCNKHTVGRVYDLGRTSYIKKSSQSDEPFINMDFYDEAVNLLNKTKKKRLTFKQWKYRLNH